MASTECQSKSLLSYKALSFDVLGTLVDWERGIHPFVLPLVKDLPATDPLRSEYPPKPAPGARLADEHPLMTKFDACEASFLTTHPKMAYEDILRQAYYKLADQIGVKAEQKDADALAASIGSWPVFPDTIKAMQQLSKHYKLIALSNISKVGIAGVLAGPLSGMKFDSVYIAEEIGSYKPSKQNFDYLINGIEKEHGIKKEDVLHIAHGVNTDQVAADQFGLHHVWVERGIDNWGSHKMQDLPLQRLVVTDMAAFAAKVAQESG